MFSITGTLTEPKVKFITDVACTGVCDDNIHMDQLSNRID